MVATEKLVSELKAAREGATLYDASAWGQFLAAGPDAAGFLHRMLSNEVQKLGVGEGRYQGLLDRKGMTLSLFYLRRLADQEFLGVTPPQLTEKTIGFLNKMKFIEKVQIRDVSQERGLIFLIGPKADEFKTGVAGEASATWEDTAFTPPWIVVSGPRDALRSSLSSFGEKIPCLSDTAFRLIRMAAGFPEYGVDLGETSILLETAVPVTHQRNKGCYPGQEVIERISTYGKGRAPRRLIPFAIPGEKVLKPGMRLNLKDGTTAGRITSSLFDPLDQVTRVMASVEAKHLDDVLSNIGECEFLPPAAP
jgi:folate-binding protein YgfZ